MLCISAIHVEVLAESLSADAKSFTRFELYTYLSEKTQTWEEGSVFYSDAGTLQARWQGQCVKGKWTTQDDGTLCRHVSAWGEDSCETYYHNGDGVSMVKNGEALPELQQEEGSTIDCNALELTLSMANSSESDSEIVKGLFTRAETIEFLSGKTVIWATGQGLYYAPDFKLEKIWNGVPGTGSWSVNEEGAVCWQIPGWGPTPCEFYYLKGEELMAVFKDKHSVAAEHVDGNRIGTF
jgi:hypothetical protein